MKKAVSAIQRFPVDGVLFLDKDAGGSSNQALGQAKRLLSAQKAGHTGTLDPFATGLLPLCFGEATKFAQGFLEADKAYEARIHLGIQTTTGDTEGAMLEQRAVSVTRAEIEAVLPRFRGQISQIPPMYSALKHEGKPLYAYARKGIMLARAPRQITIYLLEVLSWQLPYLSVRVCCSKGDLYPYFGRRYWPGFGLWCAFECSTANKNCRIFCRACDYFTGFIGSGTSTTAGSTGIGGCIVTGFSGNHLTG